MSEDVVVTTTRAKLIYAFKYWAQAAEAENWPNEHDPERSADFLIELLGLQGELEAPQ